MIICLNPFTIYYLRCNFSDMEIEMFFAKYDVDGDGEFSYEEGQQLVEDLENDMIDAQVYKSFTKLETHREF